MWASMSLEQYANCKLQAVLLKYIHCTAAACAQFQAECRCINCTRNKKYILAGIDSLFFSFFGYRSFANSSRKYQEIEHLTAENTRWAIILHTQQINSTVLRSCIVQNIFTHADSCRMYQEIEHLVAENTRCKYTTRIVDKLYSPSVIVQNIFSHADSCRQYQEIEHITAESTRWVFMLHAQQISSNCLCPLLY